MKKIFLLLPVLFLFSFTVNNTGLTKKEKKFAAKYLKETHSGLEQAISGLTAAQMDFKPAADKWSIKECVYHLALSETNLWAWIDGVIKAPANPEKRSAIKATDAQVMAGEHRGCCVGRFNKCPCCPRIVYENNSRRFKKPCGTRNTVGCHGCLSIDIVYECTYHKAYQTN
ncbi:MAG: DinB family protein [Sphingobacteriales bacterium]|nr:MAG: DinB family protein [Sphingobacteriales bacterium]